ncbi:rCG30927 [Rattus norvegicus]|uniref:RCG30927 n=1 Tax=Rattus norvegicus TaxID=10116 RepID=A6ISB9_RAT|nr:rCG30927 [Rattus norvegicus]
MKLKEDILSCTFSELSLGLCQFIQEVRRPNGEKYDPDSILYLCLGIQQVPVSIITRLIVVSSPEITSELS